MHRSFDLEVAKKFGGMLPRNESMDWQRWVDNHDNVMLVDDENVGMATAEYPGLHTVHWFYTVRGREALNLARKMLDRLFTEHKAQAIRGLTPVEIKGARWLARQVGLKSYGILEFPDGPYELFCLTKEEFYNGRT